MDALERPLLPAAAAPGRAAKDAAAALRQIRSLLVSAGVTAAMLDLPAVAPGAGAGAAVDAAVVRQIRALLVDAGVTTATLDLPGAAAAERGDDDASLSAHEMRLAGADDELAMMLSGSASPDKRDQDEETRLSAHEKLATMLEMLPGPTSTDKGDQDETMRLFSSSCATILALSDRDGDDRRNSNRQSLLDMTNTILASERPDEVKVSMIASLHTMLNDCGTMLNEAAKSRREVLHDETTESPIAQDLYNMLFLSKSWSFPCFYAALIVVVKLAMYAIVLTQIYKLDGFRDQHFDTHVPLEARVMQLLLVPVAIGIDEELMLTMDVLSEMGWAAHPSRPHATQVKYWIANWLRALDGSVWLFINASMMFHSVDVLSMFLNFAALQFLQSVDNIAFDMAKGGYLSMDLEALALEVTKTTLPSLRATWYEYSDAIVLALLFLIMYTMWAIVTIIMHQ